MWIKVSGEKVIQNRSLNKKEIATCKKNILYDENKQLFSK